MSIDLVVSTASGSAACSTAARPTSPRTTAPAAAEFTAVSASGGVLVVGGGRGWLFVLLASHRAPLLRAA